MPISDQIFMAILAMDSCNRNFHPGTTDQNLPHEGMTGAQLGTATLLPMALPVGYADASFFAQAYTLANGQTVIAYRGTDLPSADIPSGYWTGGGDMLDTQAEMAIQFYKDVVAAVGPNVVLTGHSMGAGHAPRGGIQHSAIYPNGWPGTDFRPLLVC